MPLVKVQSRGTQNVGGGRKNLIINGAMEVAQRGTSASSKTASDYYTCDRWRTEASGATFNTSQQSNTASDMATTGAKHFLRMEVTTANNNSGISQKIETKNIRQFKGEKLTLSFYAKGTNPNGGSFDVVRQFDDGSASSTQEKSSLTVTSSFVKYTYTFDYPDEGSVTMTDANAKMALSFLQPDGDTSTNAWTLDITAVQLEVGSQATPFEHRSFGEELALCQRYYYRRVTDTSSQYLCDAFTTSSTQIVGLVQFPVEMRAAPTQAGEDLEDAVFRHDGGTNAFDSFSGIAGVPSKSGTAAFITTSGLSANKSGFIRHHDGAVGLNFDAEL